MPEILKFTDAQRYSDTTAEEFIFANFYKDKRFYIAKVNKKSFERVDWMIEDFGNSNPLSHTFLRFKLKPNEKIILYEQSPEGHLQKEVLKEDIAVSIDGVGGYGFDAVLPLKGMNNHYVLAYRFMPISEKGKIAIQKLGRSITFIPLKADPARVFETILKESTRSQLKIAYNTLDKNCTSEVYRLLVLSEKNKVINNNMLRSLNPRKALFYLNQLDLINKSELRKNQNSFNKEFYTELKNKIASPEEQ